MNKLTAIAIDDEPIALEIIQNLAEQVPYLALEVCFINAFEAIDYLKTHQPDIIFLDIKMPDISGIALMDALPSSSMVIFTTAYSEHAVEGFELDAVDYLLKPFSQARFVKACEKALEQKELRSRQPDTMPGSSVFVKSGYEFVRLETEKLNYAQSIGNYVRFELGEESIVTRMTMAEAEALLPVKDFIRIHRSYLVAGKHISKIDKNSLWVEGKELPVGAAYRKAVRQYLAGGIHPKT